MPSGGREMVRVYNRYVFVFQDADGGTNYKTILCLRSIGVKFHKKLTWWPPCLSVTSQMGMIGS